MTQGESPPSGTRGVTEDDCCDFDLRAKPFSWRIPRNVPLPLFSGLGKLFEFWMAEIDVILVEDDF